MICTYHWYPFDLNPFSLRGSTWDSSRELSFALGHGVPGGWWVGEIGLHRFKWPKRWVGTVCQQTPQDSCSCWRKQASPDLQPQGCNQQCTYSGPLDLAHGHLGYMIVLFSCSEYSNYSKFQFVNLVSITTPRYATHHSGSSETGRWVLLAGQAPWKGSSGKLLDQQNLQFSLLSPMNYELPWTMNSHELWATPQSTWYSCGVFSWGSVVKMQAWSLRQLVTQFGRAARRPHVPREAAMRSLYVAADVPLPEGILIRSNEPYILYFFQCSILASSLVISRCPP